MPRFGLENLNILEIKQTGDLIKDVDKASLDSNYFLEALGMRSVGDQYISSRDYGTKHRFHCPPIRPNAFKVITAIDYTGSTILITSAGHGYLNGDTVYVDETMGHSGYFFAANGTWVISGVTTDTFNLVGSGVSGGSTSSGTNIGIVTKTPISIINGTTFYDKNTQTETEIVVGLDSSSNTRIYYYTPNGSSVWWVELTRKITCAIADASILAADQTLTIGTIAENGVTLVPATNLVQYWVCVNTSKSNQTVFITSSTATTLTVDTVIGSSGLNWATTDTLELYRFPAIKFNWTYDNGATPDFDFMQIEQQRKVTMLYTNSASPKVARQPIQIMKRDARNYFYDTNSSSYLVTLAAGWYIESDFGIPNPYTATEGTTGNPVDYNIAYAPQIISVVSNTTPISITYIGGYTFVTGNKVMIWSSDNYNANGLWTITSTGAQTFTLDGSVASGAGTSGYVLPVVETSVYNKSGGMDWLSILTSKALTAGTTQRGIRLYVTATYDGYQESDPIFCGYYAATTGNSISVYFNAVVDFALMNKNITAINFYADMANETEYNAGWQESPRDYRLIQSYDVQGMTNSTTIIWNNINYPTKGKKYYAWRARGSYGGTTTNLNIAGTETIKPATDGGAISINDALNHAVDKNRSYPTPTFVTKGTRDQGSIIVFNEGDTKLHTSLYDGYGEHQDDNFPDVAIDNNGNKMLIQMLGSSELIGLEILYDTIFAFRNNMIETYDLQGVPKRTYIADVVSKKSIIATPYGIVYAGKNAIYIIPSDGGEIRSLNELWNNYYGGNEYVTGSTQYITDAYRSAIIAGYDDIYREVNFLIQVNTETSSRFILHRFNFDDKKWRERKINTSDTIKYFTKRQADGTFTIGMAKGLLQYPNRIGSLQWEDDVLINGAATEVSQSKAVPFQFTLNVARFNNQIAENVLHGFVFDFVSESSTDGGLATVEFFANDETEAFDTQYLAVDRKMDYRTVARRGNIERLAIAITFPDSSIFKGFNMKKITLGFISGTKLGNL